MSDDRRQRPPTPRTRPIRNWSTLFPQGATTSTTNGGGAAPTAGGADGAVVARSVELGYRIIDDYIRQGEQVARRIGERSFDPAGMTRDAQDMATRMTGYAAQMTTLWMDAMQGMAGGALPGMPAGAFPAMPGAWWSPPPAEAPRGPLPRSTPAAGEARGRARVRVVVAAPGPIEVALDLRPPCPTGHLTVHALRHAEGGDTRLADVALEPPHDDEPWTLRIRVPAGQAPGAYAGAIVDDDTAEAVGMVHLRIAVP